jgi:hypothetical protein
MYNYRSIKTITQLWGVCPVPAQTTGSLDNPTTVNPSQITEINSPIVTVLWLPKED